MGLREKYFKTEKTKKKIYRTVAVNDGKLCTFFARMFYTMEMSTISTRDG